MRIFIALALVFCSSLSLFEEEIEFSKDFMPKGAIPFKYDEIDVDVGLVQRVEFSTRKCNLTLKNRGVNPANVDVSVYVLNKDGVILWMVQEHWLLDKIDSGAKFAKDYDLRLSMPESISMSKYAATFDPTPKWLVVR